MDDLDISVEQRLLNLTWQITFISENGMFGYLNGRKVIEPVEWFLWCEAVLNNFD